MNSCDTLLKIVLHFKITPRKTTHKRLCDIRRNNQASLSDDVHVHGCFFQFPYRLLKTAVFRGVLIFAKFIVWLNHSNFWQWYDIPSNYIYEFEMHEFKDHCCFFFFRKSRNFMNTKIKSYSTLKGIFSVNFNTYFTSTFHSYLKPNRNSFLTSLLRYEYGFIIIIIFYLALELKTALSEF